MATYHRRPTLLTLTTSYEDCKIEIDKIEYLKITEGFMQFMANKIIAGEEVNLPLSMGAILIAGRKANVRIEDGKIKGLAPNWKETMALWERDKQAKKEKKLIYHFNEHSRGIRYKFSWLTQNVPLRMKHIFAFKATRAHTRAVWKQVLDGKEYKIFKNSVKKITA